MIWLIIIGIMCLVFYYKKTKPSSYWKDRGVIHKQSPSAFVSFSSLIFRRKAIFYVIKELYQEFSKERYFGVHQLGTPALYIRDLELIKQITVKHFDHFTDHNNLGAIDIDPLMSKNLFNLKGQNWRDMRSTLSPSFTSSKMKIMFSLISECAEDFTNYFVMQKNDIQVVEMKDIFTRFSNDAIATAAFGLKCNSLVEKENDFYLMAKDATNISGKRFFGIIMHMLFPKIAQYFKFTFTSDTTNRFFHRIIQETIARRKNEGLFRPDMIHLLMEAQKESAPQEEDNVLDAGFAAVSESNFVEPNRRHRNVLSDEDVTAQAIIFIFGGFDTVSSVTAFVVYELAMNPDIQGRLQNEVDETLTNCNGTLTYEALHKMNYMDMVVSETLRKWPPGFQADRLCVKDYTIEPVNAWERPLLIEKGSLVLVPIIGIHYDPQYFPNPEVFDPERFNNENKHKIKPFTYFPFGSGPRSCIASRFALMEIKTLLFHLLAKFEVVRTEKTPVPLKVATATINFVAEGGIWLGLKRRNQS